MDQVPGDRDISVAAAVNLSIVGTDGIIIEEIAVNRDAIAAHGVRTNASPRVLDKCIAPKGHAAIVDADAGHTAKGTAVAV